MKGGPVRLLLQFSTPATAELPDSLRAIVHIAAFGLLNADFQRQCMRDSEPEVEGRGWFRFPYKLAYSLQASHTEVGYRGTHLECLHGQDREEV